MKKKILLFFLPCFLSLSGCGEARSGGSETISASALPTSPVEKCQSFVWEGHTFSYSNVYRDSDDNFILKDRFSYILNYDLVFGVRFSDGGARAYKSKEGADPMEECTLMQVDGGQRYYSIEEYGFQIMINRSLDSTVSDVNIGKITHWC